MFKIHECLMHFWEWAQKTHSFDYKEYTEEWTHTHFAISFIQKLVSLQFLSKNGIWWDWCRLSALPREAHPNMTSENTYVHRHYKAHALFSLTPLSIVSFRLAKYAYPSVLQAWACADHAFTSLPILPWDQSHTALQDKTHRALSNARGAVLQCCPWVVFTHTEAQSVQRVEL